MNPFPFEKLREGQPGCPSDLALDRFIAKELPKTEREPLDLHLQGCESCQGRVAARRSGFAAFPEVDERKLLAAIRRRLDEEPEPGLWQRLARFLRTPRYTAALTFALGAAALAVVLLRPGGLVPGPGAGKNAPPELDQVRIKGSGPALHVYRQRGDSAEELASGDVFHPGDNLRFAVDLPTEGTIAIFGIDGSGELYTAWPMSAQDAAQIDTERPAQKGQQLPGAVTLDESPGDESLYLVECPHGSGPPKCITQGTDQPPACTKGCAMIRFVLKKVP